MSYVKRRINVTIQLGSGSFDGTNANTVTLKGLRVIAQLTGAGAGTLTTLNCQIFGLPLAIMNQLTVIGQINQVGSQNTILIEAGDEGKTLTTMFKGYIYQAWADFQCAPDVVLNIAANPGAVAALRPVDATSIKGAADVSGIMRGLATLAGLKGFEDGGVQATLSNPCFNGAALEQIQTCARAADINYLIDGDILAIWPKNGARGGPVPLISAATGMVGYPAFYSGGVTVVSEFIPDIRLGGKVQIKSDLKPACGIWNVFSIIHELESERPGGAWFTQVSCWAPS